MAMLDETVLGDERRLAAVGRARRTMPELPLPIDAIAGLAARLLGAPIGMVTFVGDSDEHFAGMHGVPAGLGSGRQAPLAYSVCKYVVSQDGPVSSADMAVEEDRELRDHPLRHEYGIRAFLGVPLRGADDQPIGSLTVMDTKPRRWRDADLTALVEIALVLTPEPAVATPNRKEAFVDALLDNLDVGVIAVDAGGEPLVVNRALRRVHGLPDDWDTAGLRAAVDDSLREVDGTPMPRPRRPLSRALRGEAVRDVDVLIRAADQREHIFVTHAQPLVGGDGRKLGAVAVLHDVTAIRRAERFRACEEEITRILVAAATVGDAVAAVLRVVAETLRWPHAELWLVDPVTGDLHRTGHWSTVAGQCDDPHEGTAEKGAGIMGTVWATGRPLWVPDVAETDGLEGEESLTRARACARLGLHTALAVPIRDGGDTLGVLACYAATREEERDLLTVLVGGVASHFGLFVTLRRAADLAEQLARTRNDFLALVGHELRTPLSAISSYAGVLAEDPAVAADGHRMVVAIERNADMLRTVVDDLLELAGMEAGHLKLTVSMLDLTEIVAEAVAAAEDTAGAGGVRLHTRLPDRLLLRGDRARLRQVVDNLLANAVAYSPGGGDVRIELTADDTTAILRVSDSGIGVPPGEQHRLFDRFYRASNVAHQGFPGAGLGLALVHTIAVLHRGSITLDAAHTPGASLLLRLPIPG